MVWGRGRAPRATNRVRKDPNYRKLRRAILTHRGVVGGMFWTAYGFVEPRVRSQVLEDLHSFGIIRREGVTWAIVPDAAFAFLAKLSRNRAYFQQWTERNRERRLSQEKRATARYMAKRRAQPGYRTKAPPQRCPHGLFLTTCRPCYNHYHRIHYLWQRRRIIPVIGFRAPKWGWKGGFVPMPSARPTPPLPKRSDATVLWVPSHAVIPALQGSLLQPPIGALEVGSTTRHA